MMAAFYIAINTFRENIRNRSIYIVLFFVVLLILLSISFGQWSVFARIQVVEDFGLAAMSISGLLLAVFTGVGILGKEFSTKTIYHILTKPVSRHSFIIGKFIGLLSVLAFIYLLMSIFFAVTVIAIGGKITMPLLTAIIGTGMETALMISAAIFFSTFSSAIPAAIFSCAFYVAGHLNDALLISNRASGFPENLLKTVYYIIPNLEYFNLRVQAIYNTAMLHGFTAWVFCYGLLYITLFMILSCMIFSKKDL
jgi:Cu-processing system permease protein